MPGPSVSVPLDLLLKLVEVVVDRAHDAGSCRSGDEAMALVRDPVFRDLLGAVARTPKASASSPGFVLSAWSDRHHCWASVAVSERRELLESLAARLAFADVHVVVREAASVGDDAVELVLRSEPWPSPDYDWLRAAAAASYGDDAAVPADGDPAAS